MGLFAGANHKRNLTSVRIGKVNLREPNQNAVFLFSSNESNFTLWNGKLRDKFIFESKRA